MLPTRWDLISQFKGKRVLDIGGVGYKENEPRKSFFRKAWSRALRTTLDINPSADIVADLNKPDSFPKIKQKFDVISLFAVLEHIKYPAEILELLPPTKEYWIILPSSSYILCQQAEVYYQQVIPGFKHIIGWNMPQAVNFLTDCGYSIVEKGYIHDYQTWKGRLYSIAAGIIPIWLAREMYFKCVRGK